MSNSQQPAHAPPLASYDKHHHVAITQNNAVNLFTFLRGHDGDPAIKVNLTSYFGGII
jgi:hypothetical protein